MPDFFKTTANGWRTPTPTAASRFYSAGVAGALQVHAGPLSEGIVVNGASRAASIQFGPSSTDPIPNTSFTSTPAEHIGGTAPEKVEILSDGSQELGYGRVHWDYDTKVLTTRQFKDDNLVSNTPRCQYYLHPGLHQGQYYRFNLEFKLGNDKEPWPDASQPNSILIFQIPGDATSYPPFDVHIRPATNGDLSRRNIAILRRLVDTNVGGLLNNGQDYVALIENIVPSDMHKLNIEMCLDWVSQAAGGRSSIKVWYNNKPFKLHEHVGGGFEVTDRVIYEGTNSYYLPMIGIYRTNLQGVKAPDNCTIFWHRIEMEQSLTPFTRP